MMGHFGPKVAAHPTASTNIHRDGGKQCGVRATVHVEPQEGDNTTISIFNSATQHTTRIGVSCGHLPLLTDVKLSLDNRRSTPLEADVLPSTWTKNCRAQLSSALALLSSCRVSLRLREASVSPSLMSCNTCMALSPSPAACRAARARVKL